MSEIVWTKRAVADLERLFHFLKEKNPDAAKRAASQILEAADRLVANPRMGKPMPDETGRRELSTSFGRRGYVLRYRLDEDGETPVIIRVWHFLEAKE